VVQHPVQGAYTRIANEDGQGRDENAQRQVPPFQSDIKTNSDADHRDQKYQAYRGVQKGRKKAADINRFQGFGNRNRTRYHELFRS
jgi:hypothetical protein